MKFLIDAQLPARLVRHLVEAGHDAIHTLDLSGANRTRDDEIADRSDVEDRVVVSKDGDFRDSHLLRGTPKKLLIVATGNIANQELLALFDEHVEAIVAALDSADLVELGSEELTVHDKD